MWRWAVIATFVFVAHVQMAQAAGNVACAYGAWATEAGFTVGSGTARVPNEGVSASCFTSGTNCKSITIPTSLGNNNFMAVGINTVSDAGNYVPGVMPTEEGVLTYLDHFTPIGEPCGSPVYGIPIRVVIVPVEEYNVLIGSADVVAKLQEGYELGTVAVIVFGLLAGFVFGYRLVQRRDSQ